MIGWWVRGVLSLCLCLAVVLVCLFVPLVVLALLPFTQAIHMASESPAGGKNKQRGKHSI